MLFYLVLFFLDKEREREREQERERREGQREGEGGRGRRRGGERPFLTLKISVAKYCKFFIRAETDFSFCNNSSRLDFCLDIVFLEPYDVCR